MIYLLILAIVTTTWAEEIVDTNSEIKPAESAMPIRVHDPHDANDQRRYRFEDGLELIRYRDHAYRSHLDRDHDDRRGAQRPYMNDEEHSGPYILRSVDPHHNHEHPDIERQNKIIAHVFSPDYYQPTWILDYRYQKTGGRDYTRGPGGQILILPKNMRTNEHKEFADFDALLEHLRLNRIAEEAARAKAYERNIHGHHGQGMFRPSQAHNSHENAAQGHGAHGHGLSHNAHAHDAHGPATYAHGYAPGAHNLDGHAHNAHGRMVHGNDVHGHNVYRHESNLHARQYINPYSPAEHTQKSHGHH